MSTIADRNRRKVQKWRLTDDVLILSLRDDEGDLELLQAEEPGDEQFAVLVLPEGWKLGKRHVHTKRYPSLSDAMEGSCPKCFGMEIRYVKPECAEQICAAARALADKAIDWSGPYGPCLEWGWWRTFRLGIALPNHLRLSPNEVVPSNEHIKHQLWGWEQGLSVWLSR